MFAGVILLAVILLLFLLKPGVGSIIVALLISGWIGMSRLVRESCDLLVSIPMKGHISSLNASAAATVLLYEALRQRESKE